MEHSPQGEELYTIIYRPWFRTKNGKLIRARDYGKSVFALRVKIRK